MNDLLPAVTARWQHMEQIIRDLLSSYGYQEIRPPIIESTELFSRSIGNVTDIVEKEMYTFSDRNGQSLSLRPECTASCVRAAIQHRLGQGKASVQRLWVMGPMFRYERPQRGRCRQFHQLDVEIYGDWGPSSEVELLLLSARLWRQCGLNMQLNINSLGTRDTQANYRKQLVAYFSEHREALDEDSCRRLESNPLRILDSKVASMQALIEQAPKILSCLDNESKQHFEQLQHMLTVAGLPFTVNPRLVRGLDYYTGTVFEWTTNDLGSQNAVCGGGRYDALFSDIGGPQTPAIGFAIGLERLVALLETDQVTGLSTTADIALLPVGSEATAVVHHIAEQLRDTLPRVRIVIDSGDGSFKGKLRRANRDHVRYVLLIGDNEARQQQVVFKDMGPPGQQELLLEEEIRPQTKLSWSELPEYLKNLC